MGYMTEVRASYGIAHRKAMRIMTQAIDGDYIPKASRIFKPDLLPHQVELLRDTTTSILGMTAGFGSGKTWSVARKVVQLLLLNPGYDGIVTEPTVPLLVKILYPELERAFDDAGLKWKFNKQDKIYVVRVKGKNTRVICDSMENYTRLIGVNAAWVVCDEFDTSKHDLAIAAFEKLLARIRTGFVNQFVIVSTPEGFRAMYQIFVKEKDKYKRLIKARTADNHHLKPEYIERLRAQYPDNLIEAYLNGEFVNLTSGTIYTSYDRTLNNSKEEIQPGEELYIGQDFNVTAMASVIYVMRMMKLPRIINGKKSGFDTLETLHAVAEIPDGYDTPDVISKLIAAYQQPHDYHPINIYPDASGKSRKSVDASKSDIALLEESGFGVHYEASNPFVKDRILAVNGMYCNGYKQRRLYINGNNCPRLVECVSQQVWDKKTGQPDKKAGVDHMNDAKGYPVAMMYPIIRPMATADLEVEFY